MDLEIVLIIFITLSALAAVYSFTIITIDLIAEIKQKHAEKKKAAAEKKEEAKKEEATEATEEVAEETTEAPAEEKAE